MNIRIPFPTSRTARRAASALVAVALMSTVGIATAGPATPGASSSATTTLPAPAGALSVTVRYDDLNLMNAAGTETLYRRLAAAAREVCPDTGGRDLTLQHTVDSCRHRAIHEAAAKVPSSRLAAMVAKANTTG